MTDTTKSQKALKLEANAAAKQRVLDDNPASFRLYLQKEYEQRGLELEPNADERAEAQLRKLLDEHPDVFARFIGEQSAEIAVRGKKVPEQAPLTATVQDVALPDTDAEIHRVVQQFASEPDDGIEDDAELPPDHDVTPPNENPVDPFARTEP